MSKLAGAMGRCQPARWSGMREYLLIPLRPTPPRTRTSRESLLPHPHGRPTTASRAPWAAGLGEAALRQLALAYFWFRLAAVYESENKAELAETYYRRALAMDLAQSRRTIRNCKDGDRCGPAPCESNIQTLERRPSGSGGCPPRRPALVSVRVQRRCSAHPCRSAGHTDAQKTVYRSNADELAVEVLSATLARDTRGSEDADGFAAFILEVERTAILLLAGLRRAVLGRQGGLAKDHAVPRTRDELRDRLTTITHRALLGYLESDPGLRNLAWDPDTTLPATTHPSALRAVAN